MNPLLSRVRLALASLVGSFSAKPKDNKEGEPQDRRRVTKGAFGKSRYAAWRAKQDELDAPKRAEIAAWNKQVMEQRRLRKLAKLGGVA